MKAAKDELNIDDSFNADDNVILLKIKAARTWIENRLGRSLITQERRQYMDKFPCGPIELLNGPVQYDGDELTIAVKYYDSNDAEQTWATTNYWFDNNGYIPKIVPKYSYPSAGERPSAIWVEYTAGYGDNPDDVPANIRSAILMLTVHMYENRLMELPGQLIGRIQWGVESLISMDTMLQNTAYGTRY